MIYLGCFLGALGAMFFGSMVTYISFDDSEGAFFTGLIAMICLLSAIGILLSV